MGTQLRDNSQDVGYKYLYEFDIKTWALISNVNYKKNFSRSSPAFQSYLTSKTLRLSIPAQNWKGIFVIFPLPTLISKHMQLTLRTYSVIQSYHGTHASGARKRGPILVLAFSHITNMFVHVSSKKRNALGL